MSRQSRKIKKLLISILSLLTNNQKDNYCCDIVLICLHDAVHSFGHLCFARIPQLVLVTKREGTAMDKHPDWYDLRYRNHLQHLDGPGLAQELLRQIPAYVSGYRALGQRLETLGSIRSRHELVEQFARHWGLSCTG